MSTDRYAPSRIHQTHLMMTSSAYLIAFSNGQASKKALAASSLNSGPSFAICAAALIYASRVMEPYQETIETCLGFNHQCSRCDACGLHE